MLGDLYEITLTGRLYNQTINNVFHFYQDLEFITTNPTKAQALVDRWNSTHLPTIAEISSGDLLYTNIAGRNLYNAADAYDLAISLTGQGASAPNDTLSSFVATGFTLMPETPLVKPGSKRFAGLWESAQVDGVITDAGTITICNNVAAKLEAPVTIGTVIFDPVFLPVIVKRVRSGTPGNYEYRLPANAGEGQWSNIVVALFNAIVTSQVSRKIGVGI